MTRKALLLFVLVLLTCTPHSFSQSPAKATLRVTFVGLHSGRGNLIMALGDEARGWPKSSFLDSTLMKTNGEGDHMTIQVRSLDYGTYAISVIDDENENGDMDAFMGIPREGYGFSNNPKVRMGAPDFDECSFQIDRPLVELRIHLNYLKKEKKK